ncbi:MAG TPA: PAP/fibrillin family protein [Leptolyngbyaceae cyanobacterium]
MPVEPPATPQNEIKAKLLASIAALDPQQALLPSDSDSLTPLIEQLEACTPTPRPLSPEHRQTLLGEWVLIYASRGTVVTRRLPSVPNLFGGITLERVWQVLSVSSNQTVAAENGAVLSLPILGKARLSANGFWRWEAGEAQTAQVSFSSFSIQLLKPFGWLDWSLPDLKVPVLEILRQEAEWTTSYLDEDLRVGRGATGNLFVFKRV